MALLVFFNHHTNRRALRWKLLQLGKLLYAAGMSTLPRSFMAAISSVTRDLVAMPSATFSPIVRHVAKLLAGLDVAPPSSFETRWHLLHRSR